MPLVRVVDLADRRLRPYSGMTDGQLRRGEGFRRDSPHGLFIGESAHVIERALDAGVEPASVLVDDRWLNHDRQIVERIQAEWPEAPVFLVTPDQHRQLTGYEVVRGALACFQRPEPKSVEDVLEGARRVVILEDITNYTNMGSIFRSVAALGWDAVLVTPSCHDPFYRRCARVSMGAVFQIPWARIPGDRDWAPSFIPQLRDRGFATAALALRDNALDLKQARVLESEARLAVILGTEGDGLADSTIAACDHTICIRMHHGVDSLNVAACAAIILANLAL